MEDVSGFGGLTKEYHVDIDADKLSHYQISLATLANSIANANINVGGNYLIVGEQTFNVRGIALIHKLEDIDNITLKTTNATAVKVGQIAQTSVGYTPRLGIVGMNDRNEVVQRIVLMRKYGDTIKTLKGVEAKADLLNTSGMLPKGFKVVSYYDRTSLVHTTLRTVFENLSIGMVLVFLVLVFFLGNLRTAIIAAINIPLAMCGAFALLYITGTPANLLSLGAVDFGIIIDSTIIVMENIYRHLSTNTLAHEDELHCIRRASVEVGGPMFYSTLIFVVIFLPLFTMKGVEGVIFSPMSHTYAFALVTAILLAVTVSPVLSSFLLKKGMKETRNVVWLLFHRSYHRLFVKVVQWARVTLALIMVVVLGGLSLYPRFGWGIFAQIGGGQHLGAGDFAFDHFAFERR